MTVAATPPPHAPDAELAIIGCLAMGADLKLLGDLAPADFYGEEHARAFAAAIALAREGRPVDSLTLHAAGVDAGLIARAVAAVPSTAHLAEYARLVRNAAERRAIASSAEAAANVARDPTASLDAVRALAAATGRAAMPAGPPTATPSPAKKHGGTAQGSEPVVADPEPWPDPVGDGARLLDSVAALLARYMAMPSAARQAVALWIAAAHAMASWTVFPLLALVSATMRCGKSRLLRLVGALVPRPLLVASITPAALFRSVERWHPCLVWDEAERLSARDADPEMRALFNAGVTRETARVVRCDGDSHEPRAFSTWAPRVVAMIGDPPPTIRDRTAPLVRLRRRTPADPIAPLRQRALAAEAEPLRRQLARWASGYMDAFAAADPATPSGLDDRAADLWAPLLAVADAAMGEWPMRARAAALALSADRDETEAGEGDGVEALRDMARAFECAKPGLPVPEALPSVTIAERLNADPDGPWRGWHAGKGVTPRDLARLVRDFGVRPRTVRLLDGSTPKGYHLSDITDALAPYLPVRNPPQAPQSEVPPHSPQETAFPRSATTPVVADNGSPVNVAESPGGPNVADVAAVRRGEGGEAPPRGPCRMCGGREWWGPDDSQRCRRCHPPGDAETCPCCGGVGLWLGADGEVPCLVCRPEAVAV
ncbi:MAG: DUF3631 domain-containing protein [Planctomycetales bacterium]|nr:DUF3631 domain-containing protein [Planctomycetales bacterium]